MEYSLSQLKIDIDKEAHYLERLVSSDVSEEFLEDFFDITTKIKYGMKISDKELERLAYLYNRYHKSLAIETSEDLLAALRKDIK